MQHLDEGTIHAWLDGQLPQDEAAAAEAHVAECRPCADAVAEARGFIAASSRILMSLDNVPRDVLPKVSAPEEEAAPAGPVAAAPIMAAESAAVIDFRSRVATAARPVAQRPRRWLSGPALAAAATIVVAVGTFALNRASNREMDSSGGLARSTALAADSISAPSPAVAREAAIPVPPAAPSPTLGAVVAGSSEERQKGAASDRAVATGARAEVADRPEIRAAQPTTEGFATRKLSAVVSADTATARNEAKRKQEVAESVALADEASRLAKERAAVISRDTLARQRVGNVASASIAPPAQSRVDSVAPRSQPVDAEKVSADRRDVAAGAQASTSTGSVRGRVTDGNNTALASAQVMIAGTSIGVTTSVSGEFALGGVQPGARILLVRRVGYDPMTREITVVAGQTTTVDVTLKPSVRALESVVTTAAPVTVMRGNAKAAPAAPVPAEAAPGAAVTAGQSNAVGCYEMSITPNSPQARTSFRQTPRRLALDADIVPSNADGVWYRARDLARTGAVPNGLWRPVGTDGLELEWTYGTRVARISLTGPAGQLLRGTAEEIDRSNGTGESGSVVSTRASCTG